ncbi:hypothetical protein BKA70DRAFT_1426512 [Coprinopsis sp. MPI-PUGE-AT-0042]|nr:hypothetical protein BKA70DRAFT_1426512 [Coprinopsis sp. MPI-PUGE-AT-0042]
MSSSIRFNIFGASNEVNSSARRADGGALGKRGILESSAQLQPLCGIRSSEAADSPDLLRQDTIMPAESLLHLEEPSTVNSYRRSVAMVQEELGLQNDDKTFWRVKAAVAAAARKLSLTGSEIGEEVALKNRRHKLSSKIERAAWWVSTASTCTLAYLEV